MSFNHFMDNKYFCQIFMILIKNKQTIKSTKLSPIHVDLVIDKIFIILYHYGNRPLANCIPEFF